MCKLGFLHLGCYLLALASTLLLCLAKCIFHGASRLHSLHKLRG